MVQPGRRFIVCLLALALVFGMAGCSAAAAAGQKQTGTKASVQPVLSDNQSVLDYLKAARSDLGLIDEIMADSDLGLLEEETDSEEEFTAELLDKYETILTEYITRIHTTQKDIDTRTVPDLPDIGHFQSAEKAAFETLESILQEYVQTLAYTGTILRVGEDLARLESLQETDLQAIYDAFSTALGDAIAAMEAADVPSFLESFNVEFIDAFKQLDNAVFYMLSALSMDDPVRTDAAGYLVGILDRRLDNLSTAWEQDLADRQDALRDDARDVQKTCQGLVNWLDANIAKLGVS